MQVDDILYADEIDHPDADERQTSESNRVTAFFRREGIWADHPAYPVEDWQYDTVENNTRLGYVDWCVHMAEAEEKPAEVA